MVKTLQMVFRNEEGKEVVVSLAEPKDDLTVEQVNGVMSDIIAKNVFDSKGGDLVQVVEARMRSSDSVVLE